MGDRSRTDRVAMTAEYLSRGRKIQAVRARQKFTDKKSPPLEEAGGFNVGS
jgi:hypothetical protein